MRGNHPSMDLRMDEMQGFYFGVKERGCFLLGFFGGWLA